MYVNFCILKIYGGIFIKKFLNLFTVAVLTLILAACGNGDEGGDDGSADVENNGEDVNYSEAVDYTIYGIEPGAGITELAHNTLDTYDNLDGWTLEESSTGGMMTELRDAIDNEEPIFITGWSPHYKFVEFDLKYLDDPESGMGETEDVHTIARLGLEEDKPEAYQMLDAFSWDLEDMEQVMYEGEDSTYPEAAEAWVDNNRDKVDEWVDGIEPVDGEPFELVSMSWESEVASAQVVRTVLEELGYEVTVTDVDPAVVFQAIANGEADATVAPWLPVTQGHHYEEHEGNFEDLGANSTDTRNGIVVPEYMDIESIEELEPAE
ncbi:glycine betaine ABC transporter substrate-binding protein [Lacicoccus qingdaonensis]|uniref:Glycine betaine/proline transport system substrate-binding protein n=1 Tax=Lacicoccus qingdaonensis TaxID=576118 RepID=A0A1G9FG90_9BACL|nr:glycine betaine ABC transporter substrate-binding protein [Salinicoccus qingdaonensis]SDK87372.1 glycine betaine/proline transport system substrate-binding protein [Salinicoccus qingdaonensis]